MNTIVNPLRLYFSIQRAGQVSYQVCNLGVACLTGFDVEEWNEPLYLDCVKYMRKWRPFSPKIVHPLLRAIIIQMVVSVMSVPSKV